VCIVYTHPLYGICLHYFGILLFLLGLSSYFFFFKFRLGSYFLSRFISCHFHDYIPRTYVSGAIFSSRPPRPRQQGIRRWWWSLAASIFVQSFLELFEISRLEKTFHRVTRYRALISYQSATRKGNREKSSQIRPSVRHTNGRPLNYLTEKEFLP
jgi:hypothetical protein